MATMKMRQLFSERCLGSATDVEAPTRTFPESSLVQDQIHICESAETLACHARDWLVQLLLASASQGAAHFSLALSGGSTPKRLYQLLSQLPAGAIDWSRLLLLWGDERNVAPDHADSNFRMVKEALLDAVNIPERNILRVPNPGGSAEDAASSYQATLSDRLPTGSSGLPCIDCVLLGMGDDVHTASLFPGTSALTEQTRWVVANRVKKLDCTRITLTAPIINAARNVAFLISGTSKQAALNSLWHAAHCPEQFPSQLIRPQTGQLWFMLDRAAVGTLELPESALVQYF